MKEDKISNVGRKGDNTQNTRQNVYHKEESGEYVNGYLTFP